MAIIAIKKLFDDISNEEKLNALKKTTIITAGFAVLILLGKLFGFFDFVGGNDGYYRQNYGQEFVDALREDRASFLTMDTFRTLIFVLLSAGTIYLFLKKKFNETKVIIAFAFLIIVDLVSVDRRYVNNEDFVSKIKMERPYQANKADLQILKDDSNYRVYDLTSGGAKASYFHNALGGYHAAKPKRYQDLYEFYLSNNNINVLNMLNAKYIIGQGENGEPFPYVNNEANGNAWFVKQLKNVETADQEIKALDSLDNKNVAIFSIAELQEKKFQVDSTASIKVETYKPNYIKYNSNNSNDGFAVFSEMYYSNGWNAYIDGNLMPHYKVNYALRGLQIPKGKHTVEFKFEPKVVKTGSQIALASSVILFLLIIGGLFYQFKTSKPE